MEMTKICKLKCLTKISLKSAISCSLGLVISTQQLVIFLYPFGHRVHAIGLFTKLS